MSKPSVSALFFEQLVPYLKPLFNVDDEEKFFSFQKLVNKYIYYVFTLDRIIDQEISWVEDFNTAAETLKRSQEYSTTAILGLGQLFEPENNFWKHFNSYMNSYYEGLVLEKKNSALQINHTLESFEAYSFSKHAPAFIPVVGLFILFKSKIDSKKVLELFNQLFYGMQMLDDTEDFSEDVIKNQHTYCISAVNNFMVKHKIEEKPDLDRFKERVFYISGIAEKCNTYATQKFKIAQDTARELNLSELVIWIDTMLQMLEHNRIIIKELTT
ncbi:hypothetical protein [Leeuwenhoekiella sp. NPDC079379]|uniref:hypothetical protein n=1 Tax=Leeuwenhoekiella sp. NPDC079379 TaxID=3364122 RepID=UPI0037C61B00